MTSMSRFAVVYTHGYIIIVFAIIVGYSSLLRVLSSRFVGWVIPPPPGPSGSGFSQKGQTDQQSNAQTI